MHFKHPQTLYITNAQQLQPVQTFLYVKHHKKMSSNSTNHITIDCEIKWSYLKLCKIHVSINLYFILKFKAMLAAMAIFQLATGFKTECIVLNNNYYYSHTHLECQQTIN